MLRKVQKFIEDNHLLQIDDRPVIVGVSGGSDSVVLLDILMRLGYKCIIAHCNFHLRMDESNRDERFVSKLAVTLSVPIQTIDFDTFDYRTTNNISIEMAARELRYAWFEELVRKYNAQAVAVGHHLDDNIETTLINLTRGTGLKGLTGIPVRNGNVVRPLLTMSRNQINQYIAGNKLIFVEDSTNQSTDIIRNKIRHQLIPLMEEINPSFRMSMSQTNKNIKAAYNIYQETINQIIRDVIIILPNKVSINLQKLQTYTEKVTILYEILKAYQFNPDQTRQITESLESTAGKMFYSSTHVLLKDRENIILQRIEYSSSKHEYNSTYKLETNLQFRFFEKNKSFEYSKSQHTIHIDADKVILPLSRRGWQTADYFYPLGMKHKKKLSDFLIDEKINRLEKQKVQVLVSKEQIVWIIGLRMDDRFKVTEATQNILEVTL